MIRFRFRLVYYNAYNWIVTLFFLINKMFLLPIKIKNKKKSHQYVCFMYFGCSNIVSASHLVYILLPTFYFQCKFSVAFIRFWLAPLPLLDGNFFSCSDFWMCVILRNFLVMEWQEPLSSLAAEYQSGSPILLEKIKVLCVLCIFLLLWLLFSL